MGIRVAAFAAAAAALVAGCGGAADDEPPTPEREPSGIRIVNESRKDVLVQWIDKELGHHGYGNTVVRACSERPILLPPGDYRVLLAPTDRGVENVDWDVSAGVRCCMVISQAGSFSVAARRPQSSRCVG